MQFRRDRLTLSLAFLLPLLSLLLFGFAVRLEIKHVSLAIQNFDTGLMSYSLVDSLLNNGQFDASEWRGRFPLEDALDKGKARAAVIIPPEFSRELKQGHSTHVQVIIDATDVNNARVIKNSIIGTINGFHMSNHLIPSHLPVECETRLWFNPGRREALYIVPGALAVVLWIYPSLLAALAMVREIESGTILQAYASSITATEFLSGKVLAYLIISSTMAGFLIFCAIVIFDICMVGDPTPYIVGLLCFLLSSVCFGSLIGTAMHSQNAAVQTVGTAGFIPALLFSGYIYPIRNVVYPLSYLTMVVPTRWFVQLSRDSFLRGCNWSYDWYLPLILATSAAVFFGVAYSNISTMQIKSKE